MGTQLSMETKLKNERDKWRHKDELHMKERVQRKASLGKEEEEEEECTAHCQEEGN